MRVAIILTPVLLSGESGALAENSNIVANPVIAGKPLFEWMPEAWKWRADRTNSAAVAEAIKAADKKALPLLKACFSKEGFAPDKAASANVIEDWRGYAFAATLILGTNGAWLTDDLLRIIGERGWKGREFAVSALTCVSPSNPKAMAIAFADLNSTNADTRSQAVIQFSRTRGSNEAIRGLLMATDDPSEKVRSWAIHSLGDFIWDQTVRGKLEEIEEDKKRTDGDRMGAKFVLNRDLLEGLMVDASKLRRKESESKGNK